MQLYLSQLDPKWSQMRIGSSYTTLGRSGCLTVCLSMALADFGLLILPQHLAEQKQCYTNQGLLIWSKMQDFLRSQFPGRQIDLYRYYGRNDFEIRKYLKPGTSVMLEVASRTHWVKADRKMLLRNDYNCRDPWKGKGCAAVGDYKNITGYAILTVK